MGNFFLDRVGDRDPCLPLNTPLLSSACWISCAQWSSRVTRSLILVCFTWWAYFPVQFFLESWLIKQEIIRKILRLAPDWVAIIVLSSTYHKWYWRSCFAACRYWLIQAACIRCLRYVRDPGRDVAYHDEKCSFSKTSCSSGVFANF